MPSSISKSRDLLCNTPSPGQWLSKRLAELDKTQRWLAHEIGYDTTQVNKWISGRERIPNKALMMAGASLGGSDFEVARNILVINTLIEGLPNDALKATQSNAETSFALAKALAQNAEDSATQLSSEESDRLIYLQSHLATASEVLMMTSQCVAGSDDLIREANVRKHLCFPFNVM